MISLNTPFPRFDDPDVLQDPYLAFKKVRTAESLHFAPEIGCRMITRFSDAVEILRDPETYSSNTFSTLTSGISINPYRASVATVLDRGIKMVPSLLWADGETHARHSRIVRQAFRSTRIKQLEEVIEKIVAQRIETIADSDEIEFNAALAVPVSAGAMAAVVGVPPADQRSFWKWSDSFVIRYGTILPEEDDLRMAQDTVDLQNYLLARIEEVRVNPRDDLLTDLVSATGLDEDPLSNEELVTICVLLVVAGNETTRGLVASVLLALLRDTQLMAKARSGEEQLLAVIEETLRHQSPAGANYRLVTKNTILNGQRLEKGTLLGMMWGAINRDPERFDHPDAFDAERTPNKHMAFGRGAHGCIGQFLARTETKIAIGRFLKEFSSIELVPQELHYHPSVLMRNLETLQVRVSRG